MIQITKEKIIGFKTCGKCSAVKRGELEAVGIDKNIIEESAGDTMEYINEEGTTFLIDVCGCGRPTKYTTDEYMIAKVDEYLESCVDVDRELEKGFAVKVNLPKRVGLANFFSVTEDTLNNWAEKHPKFLGALKKLDQLQQERLIDSGLSGDYNPTIAKLLLSSNHGMAEKTETDVTSKGESIASVDNELKQKVDTILNDYISSRNPTEKQ